MYAEIQPEEQSGQFSDRLSRLQKAMQLVIGGAESEDVPETAGLHHHAARALAALSIIDEGRLVLESLPTAEEAAEKKQSPPPPTPLEQMHAAYRNHPEVIKASSPVLMDLPSKGVITDDFHNATRQWPLLNGLEEETELKHDIDEGVAAFLKMSDTPSPEARQLLEAEVIKGTKALQRFFEANVRLPLPWVNRIAKGDDELAGDLLIAALAKLPHAIELFDPSKGFKFSTYGVWWIRQSIQRELESQGLARLGVRLPGHVLKNLRSLRRFNLAYEQHHGEMPNDATLLENGHKQETIDVYRNQINALSLDMPLGEDQTTDLYNFIGAADDGGYNAVERDITITPMLNKVLFESGLNTTERIILCLRSGLSLGAIMTREAIQSMLARGMLKQDPDLLTEEDQILPQTAVGKVLGMSAEKVRKLENTAIAKCRRKLKDVSFSEVF